MKRSGYIKRKVGLKPGTKRLRAKRMKAVSPKRAQKRAKSIDLQRDAHGYSILEANAYFQGRKPVNKGDVDCVEVLRQMHDKYSRPMFVGNEETMRVGTCWLCGESNQIEAAHIVPRSDELCNINMLCGRFSKNNCHGLTEKNWKMLPKLLAIKLKHDPLNADFRRIAELRGRLFLFDTLA